MKRSIILTITLVAFLGAVSGPRALAGEPVERVYVSCDKSVYVAGDNLWCSAFCLDVSSGAGLSSLSSVAYVELVAPGVIPVTGKISLTGGRGGGLIHIPSNLPTGNYKLFAYTAYSRDEEGFDPLQGAKTVSVFNTSSASRTSGGVDILSSEEYDALSAQGAAASGNAAAFIRSELAAGALAPLTIDNSAGKAFTGSVSVYHEDAIVPVPGSGIGEYLQAVGTVGNVVHRSLPEYDGEVVRAVLNGSSKDYVATHHEGLVALMSSTGIANDCYAGSVKPDGTLVFTTNNIYGDKELVCEILGMETGTDCHFELVSPFINPAVKDVPPLKMSTGIGPSILARRDALFCFDPAAVDTLASFLPIRQDPLFNPDDCKVYHLDDYTRFPTMLETFTEIMPEIRTRRRHGHQEIRLLMNHTVKVDPGFTSDVLVMLDGVPVPEHERLLAFDPMLIDDVRIYPYIYRVGVTTFNGVINFVTKKGNISSLTFDKNVRIVDFEGCSYPAAWCTGRVAFRGRDLRQTLLWHPAVEVGAGKSLSLNVRTPEYPGTFKVVVEGVCEDGSPVHCETSFTVK